jgi:hypothetical protein
MKVNSGLSMRFMSEVPNHEHKPSPEVYMKCTQCDAITGCFCHSCVFEITYTDDEKLKKCNDSEGRDLIKTIIDEKDEEDTRNLKLILTTRDNPIILCSLVCWNNWRVFPKAI